MGWWHKITKTWIALSARIKLRKSRISGGRVGGTGEYSNDCGRMSGGLLKLRDDVRMCGYRDVEVMWNMLNISLQHDQMERVGASKDLFPGFCSGLAVHKIE
ncbi:hypothetical protein PHAVU_003G137400 [Phaseolus vulgaris]|uniref:Uncharacterized protein n=1 Tax=Phaseolus vulgaris TaxID=3885 RepID=V7C962_PHAVU|nr:hypothetical protein PHAVU_003G137400g [Phaseolus vulgaris]ESW26659.1 hypothetical protein PHAVU_003G137400g [Phaseolus vulgaris]